VSARKSLAYWTDVLCGIEQERTLAAFAVAEAWKMPSVAASIGADTIDAAVSATLLVEGIDDLVDAGVERARLLKKLRTGDFWPTWAEIRVASILLRSGEGPVAVELEPGRADGAHPDWRFTYPGEAHGVAIEVKAVGLSDAEAAFCRRQASSLEQMLPGVGIGHGHAPIDAPSAQLTKEQRRYGDRVARRLSRHVPGFPQGLRGAVIVGHDTEATYRRRIASKISDAVRQLPSHDDCWVALYWSNGAPIRDAGSAIDWTLIPAHVSGILFVGQGVAFPHRNIHCFASRIPREQEGDAEPLVISIEGETMTSLAELVLQRFERSAGVRATLLRIGRRTLLRRDGRERLHPFNLLLDTDPDFPPGGEFNGREAVA